MKNLSVVISLLKKNLPLIALILITLIICFTNYTPGTYLTGWDTLHPEFNYRIYWSRIIDGVWQEHQGLGAVASQSHAAEIPRMFVLMLIDLFFSTSFVRYAYLFLMLILGPIGVYLFVKRILLSKFTSTVSDLGAFAAGIFYLLNFGTLQHTYVPLEMFLTHFGFLGFFFLYTIEFIETRSKKSLIKFIAVTLVSTSQAHTSTLFYTLMLCYVSFLGLISLPDALKRNFQTLKSSLTLILLTLVVNSFWLLPNIYFAVNHGREIQSSKIHRLFSEEAFLQNKEFGNLRDVSILRNFLFNWGEHTGNAEFGDLLDEWKVHLANPIVLPLGYLFFTFVIVGIVLSIAKKEKYAPPLYAIFVICLFFLINVNPPFGVVFTFLQENIPLFKEAFRFPFTKFSVLLMFVYASFFGYYFGCIYDQLTKFLRSDSLKIAAGGILYILVAVSLVFYMWPAFNGKLISPTMRVEIPERYFELFDYFDRQTEYGRVANFPIHSFWGWIYYDWDTKTQLGYQGAGFLWFGIKQPLMDREFDRWGLDNELYYQDVSQAVYSQDVAQLERVLDKYKIKWIVLDESVISPGSNSFSLFYPEINKLLSSSEKIILDRSFGAGLKVFKYQPQVQAELIEIKSAPQKINSMRAYLEADESIKEDLITSDEDYIHFLPSGNLKAGLTTFKHYPYEIFTAKGSANELKVRIVSKTTNYEKVISIFNSEEPNILRVGEDVFFLNRQTDDYQKAGIAVLPSTGSVALYSYTAVPVYAPVNYRSRLEACSSFSGGSSYSLEYLSTGFALSSRGTSSCVTLPSSELLSNLPAGAILMIKSDISEENSIAESCFFDAKNGLCLNQSVGKGASLVHLPQDAKASEYYLRFVNIPGDLKTLSKTTFNNISLSIAKEVGVSSATVDISKENLVLRNGLVFSKVPYLTKKMSQEPSRARVCRSADIEFEEADYSLENSYISYKAIGESLCDSYYFPLAKHDTGYVLEVRSRNIDGMPMRLCLTNEFSKRCDIYVSLSDQKEFTTQYFLVPPMDSLSGYTVNISNLNFGKTSSLNELESISLVPISYDLVDEYFTEVRETETGGLLIYNQAYEDGWVALCGLSVCPYKHIKYDGWANAWLIDDSADDAHIRIVFWPQLLEYFGFILLIGALVWSSRRPTP